MGFKKASKVEDLYNAGKMALNAAFSSEPNEKLALSLFEEAAGRGHVESMYEYGKLSKDPKEKVKYLRKAIEKKHADAMFEYGSYLEEKGEFAEAALYYLQAIGAGSKLAKEYVDKFELSRGVKMTKGEVKTVHPTSTPTTAHSGLSTRQYKA